MSTAPLSSSAYSSYDRVVDSVHGLDDSLHVWWLFHPAHTAGGVRRDDTSMWDWLSDDELTRANQFHFSHHAEEWVANRAKLRMILGKYLGQDGKKLTFTYDAGGKPRINVKGNPLQFNLSHTEGLALVAVVQDHCVGVDVERSGSNHDFMDLARSAFSKSEVDIICRMSGATAQQTFLKLWTCKEAFLKGLGEGLSRPMNEFSLAFDQPNPRITECLWDPSNKERWQLYSLDAPADFVASIAVESFKRHSIKTFTWMAE